MNSAHPKDIPAVLALVLLGGTLLLLWIAHQGSIRNFDYGAVELFLDRNAIVLAFGLSTFFLNIMWIAVILNSRFGLNKQGTRLTRLIGKHGTGRFLTRYDVTTFLAFGMVTFLLARFWKPGSLSGELPYLAPAELTKASLFFQINMAVLLGFLAVVVEQMLRPFGDEPAVETLPPFPIAPNSVVLGSTNETVDQKDAEEVLGPPQWVTLNQKALNGNILITGSIGGGKSQGTILPYFDQILQNFSPSPAVLAIDPKGSLLDEAAAIAKARGLGDQLVCLTLGGNVTFNPIYEADSLQSARFLNIARMVRAAAVNFMGRPFDDPFWEESAFNLVKNTLAYCAACADYYTLNDLYEAMIRANDRDVAPDLDAALKRKPFTVEEQFNIRQAQHYFSKEFIALEDRVRTSILATSTSFLNQFREYQASQIFCPTQDRLTLPSIDRAIDDGQIILFGITNPGLARSMGTFVKLHYEQSLLNRLLDKTRSRARTGVLIVDEYQDFVSTTSGSLIGDNSFLAKGRESNTLCIMATQSLTSLFNAVGKEESAQELIQNFRTRIAGHSLDLKTIHAFQELVGKKDFRRSSHSVSELTQNPKLNLLSGRFESSQANLSESVNVSEYKDYAVTGSDFSGLPTFQCFAHIYDGVRTSFLKLFLKPHFLKEKATLHCDVLRQLASVVAVIFGFLTYQANAFAFPNICDPLSTSHADSCIDFSVSACMCGWPVPRPCAHFSYYLPQTFVEVFPDRKASFFDDLPGTAIQLAGKSSAVPYGAEADLDTNTYQSHTVSVPFQAIVEEVLPCGGAALDRFCFDGMSEDLGSLWTTGSADSLQPAFLAGGLSPAACMATGAAFSVSGGPPQTPWPGAPVCSFDHSWFLKFPPSTHEPCNGWGVFYPRSGAVTGPSQTIGALMIASRMRSLSTEVFQSTPRGAGEKWEMMSPQSSACFREGENIASLETLKGVREERRLSTGNFKGHLFVVWKKFSCCRDLAEIPVAYTALETVKATCAGVGSL